MVRDPLYDSKSLSVFTKG